ncbi:MAG: hypothetical protein KA199_08235, partial [Sphingorhabdus sp.]|nr:hypothetical protein [Sphingorhabdus sp.]
MKKRGQHYVWRHYLAAWSDSNEQIACLRHGELFTPNIRKIAKTRDFYRIALLTPTDLEIINAFIEESPELSREGHRNLVESFQKVAMAYEKIS